MSELEKCYAEIEDKENMIATLEKRVVELTGMLATCLDDIGNTLVANQRNLDGRHPFQPDWGINEQYIGQTTIHQKGLDQSLSIWNEGKRVLSK